MSSTKDTRPLFLRALAGEKVERPPVWFMRQAGRSLPEYRAIRADTEFLGLCKNPELACEVTMQPIRRFGYDASIVFSDILIVPEAMGMELSFGKGEGPKLAPPIRSMDDVKKLGHFDPLDKTPFVMETVERLVAELGNTPLIGFAGAPFTVATYMIEGASSKHYLETKKMMHGQTEAFELLLDKLVTSTIDYLRAQVDAGCQVIQLFDTWAGELGPEDLLRFAVKPARRIFEALKDLDVPTIYFPRGCGATLDIVNQAGAGTYGFDWRVRLDEAWERLGHQYGAQGNLDPAILLGPIDVIQAKTRAVLAEAGGRPGHIFNLGHGILPETPIEAVEAVLEVVHGSAKS
ncbi:MAG: uroporphyrinogen decarboxylase [Deltaproteobacteria bacterium]|nr:uroporphyrinogen decarboxylase [Deltaproteobacteria bacterium]